MGCLYRRCRPYLIGFVFGGMIGLYTVTWAGHIGAPPPMPELPVNLQHYLKTLYDHFGSIEVVTTNPDGTRFGQKGEMVLLQTGGVNYIEINTNGSQQWRGVSLSDTP